MTKQEKRLLDYFLQGNEVNRVVAIVDLGIMELSSRIVALEKLGHSFNKGWTTKKNRFGENYKLRTYRYETNNILNT